MKILSDYNLKIEFILLSLYTHICTQYYFTFGYDIFLYGTEAHEMCYGMKYCS